MSLEAVLTTDQLRRLAGYAFERGDRYWRDGRVLGIAVEPDAIGGVVRGTQPYHVRLDLTAHGTLRSHCTCPLDTFCKHAVALGLAFLEQREPAPPENLRAFRTRAEVDAFAAEHDIAHVLTVSAAILAGDDRNARYSIGRHALRDFASLADVRRYYGGTRNDIAEAAYRVLNEAAAHVEDGIAEEKQRPERHADPELSRLWSRLVALRVTLRESAPPRSRAARARGTWDFDLAERTIHWLEPDRVVRSSPDYNAPQVAVSLSFNDGKPEIPCTCRIGGCTHAIALVDATLDLLEDPARVEQARDLVRELLRPSWSRALEDLAQLDAIAAKPRVQIEVWWTITEGFGERSLSPLVKKQTKRGTMSSGAQISPDKLLSEYGDALSPQDRAIAEQLRAAPFPDRAHRSYPVRAFAALVGHPRVLAEELPEQRISVERMPLGFSALTSGDHIVLEPSLENARVSPKLLRALLESFREGDPLLYVDPDHARCLLIDVSAEARRMWGVLERHGDVFPPESHAQLLERLATLEGRLPLAVPRELKGKQLAPDLVTVLRLRLLPELALEIEATVRPAPGAPLFHPGAGPREVMVVKNGERAYVRRDLGGEEAIVRAALARLPLVDAEEGPPLCLRLTDPDEALALVACAESPPAGVAFEWYTPPPRISKSVSIDKLRVKIQRKRDWFGIEGELKVEEGRIELAILLDAARRQQQYVKVGDNWWVALSDALRDRVRAVAERTFASRERLELSPGAVPAVAALAEAGARVDSAPAWQLLTERLAAAQALRPKPPATLRAKLRDYQVEGHAWLSRIAAWGAGACLADDMGLGKTVQAIALLLDRAKQGPALVLAPTSVGFNWVQELERFAPSLRPILYAQESDREKCLRSLRPKDVLIVSYGLLVRDADALAALEYSTLVVDEAQALKNPATRRARSARRLQAGFRVALSGTPFENHLGELWSVFSIVFPGLLGSWDQFREQYAVPIERHNDTDARAALSRLIRPFLLRRTKPEVARELPPRTEIEVPVALSDEEAGLYEDARLTALAEVEAHKALRDQQQRFVVLAALTRLRLLASHPKLYDARSTVASSKMRRVLELIEELHSEGHRVLVFSQFTSHLELVQPELERLGLRHLYLDGSTPAAQRAKLVAAFQRGEADVFLISLKAGGTGINLTAADYVIHLDPWWNPAVEDQATDRAHRIGQTRPVTVYRLVSKNTIEERILAMHRDKRALVADILDGTNAAARLTTRDLVALIGGA